MGVQAPGLNLLLETFTCQQFWNICLEHSFKKPTLSYPFSHLENIAKSHFTNEEAEVQKSQVVCQSNNARVAESVFKNKFHWIVLICHLLWSSFVLNEFPPSREPRPTLLHVSAGKSPPVYLASLYEEDTENATQELEMLSAARAEILSLFVCISSLSLCFHSLSFHPIPLSIILRKVINPSPRFRMSRLVATKIVPHTEPNTSAVPFQRSSCGLQ